MTTSGIMAIREREGIEERETNNRTKGTTSLRERGGIQRRQKVSLFYDFLEKNYFAVLHLQEQLVISFVESLTVPRFESLPKKNVLEKAKILPN